MIDPNAENYVNAADVEAAWASQASRHAEVYEQLLLTARAPLTLTKMDDEIYSHFRDEFPHLDVTDVDYDAMKTVQAKEKWRVFCNRYENKIQNFNMGTLIRSKALEPFGENNCFLDMNNDRSESKLLRSWCATNGAALEVRHGSLTREDVDCIVNPANASLFMRVGLSGIIANEGGKSIQRECEEIIAHRGCSLEMTEAVITKSGSLLPRRVIHAVGPVYEDGRHGEVDALRQTVENCIRLCNQSGHLTIAFPALSSGVFGFPVELCAKVMLEAAASTPCSQGSTIRFTHKDYSVAKTFSTQLELLKLNSQ